MKKLFPLMLAMLVAAPVVAAADDIDKYLELLRSDLRAGKTEILTEALELNDADGAKFWPIQRQYETELAKIADKRITLIKDYAANYDSMNSQIATKLIDRAFKLDQERTTLLKKYTGQISKAVGPATGARFAQIESFVNDLIDLQVRAETPLVPKSANDKPVKK